MKIINKEQNSCQKSCVELSRQPHTGKIPALAKKIKLSWQKPAAYLLLPLIGGGIAFLSGCTKDLSRKIQPPGIISQLIKKPEDLSERPLVPTAEDRNFVVAVVDKAEPAVVQINTSGTITVQAPQAPDAFKDPFLREFFDNNLPIQPEERIVRGVGSGFVIDSDGYILTNAHVINNADKVTVTFSNGEIYEGKVLGADPVTDVAVVKITADNLPSVELGDADEVQRGQWAIAIGNPLGLQRTVTVGVVSATDRSAGDIGVSDMRVGFIQTDAAINPGNSGGPLLNARGEVIGVNSAIISGAQGLGFAIPIDTAQKIAEQLITEGAVVHPYIGIQMVPVTPQVKQRINNNAKIDINLEADRGVLIVSIASGSPAAKAGLKLGDVIQEINNQPINTAEKVQELVEKSAVGGNLQIQVLRNGKPLQITVTPEPLATAKK